jgi:hypothetical protein
MTSFDEPDAGLLVEHVLPSLLGATYSLSQELQERTLFFGELGTALDALHGRLTVISSPPRSARKDAQYPWLWRYVSRFIVGAESRAVQHAKLWAFHWKGDDEEHLELHVSSTNLTTSAFKAQVQAGWQVRLPLGERASQRIRRTWGDLVPFLDALGASAGDIAATRVQRLITLLGHVECPANVRFIASIPGQKSAARQLKQFELSALHILTPTIGDWNDRTLAAWTADAGIPPAKIHLNWISERHPWAASLGWALSTAARRTLESNGVQLECLPTEARFTEQHREADPRWGHAKLYLLRSGRKRWLLVTSANWSVAAWGAGKFAPQNFELGVLFKSEWTELEALGERFDPPDITPFCVDRTDEEENKSALEWAEASWDGNRILLHARSSDFDAPIIALVTFMGGSDESISLTDGTAVIAWKDPEHTPITTRFTQNTEILEVDVVDLRPPAKFAETPLPEIDPAVGEALREAFLLQRYGGPVVDPETIPGLGSTLRSRTVSAPTADYSVQAWLDTRAAFHVVDQWRTALAQAARDPVLIERVRMDGKELQSLYARRNSPAAGLVVEELGWRLDTET